MTLSRSKILLDLRKIPQKSLMKKMMNDIFLEVVPQYLEKLHDCYSDLPFLPERMEIENVEKLTANLNDKFEYFIQIRNLKQALNQGLDLKKVKSI